MPGIEYLLFLNFARNLFIEQYSRNAWDFGIYLRQNMLETV